MPKLSKEAAQAREIQLLHAIDAIKKGQISSVRRAAKIYEVSETTLRQRIHGQTSILMAPQGKKLTKLEELNLTSWIVDLSSRGHPPLSGIIADAANAFLQQLRNGKKVGKNWVERLPNALLRSGQYYQSGMTSIALRPRILRLFNSTLAIFTRQLSSTESCLRIYIIWTRLASLKATPDGRKLSQDLMALAGLLHQVIVIGQP